MDHFKESEKMSSYLVAFLVSDFHYLETTTPSGIKVRKHELVILQNHVAVSDCFLVVSASRLYMW